MLKRPLAYVCLVPALLCARQEPPKAWILTAELYGSSLTQRLTLQVADGRLSGELDGDKLEGTLQDGAFHAVSRDSQNGTSELQGRLEDGVLRGSVVYTDGTDPRNPLVGSFTAKPLPARRPGPPQRHEFEPSVFHRQFSAYLPPVLHLSPGDTLHTRTVDAGGVDEQGVTRTLGGNPQTGPFYIDGALPGDTLVIHIDRLRLNRDYAISDDSLVPRATGPDLAVKTKDLGRNLRWILDREKGVARLEKPSERLKDFTVPLKPMLGCVAVAPGFGSAPIATQDSGRYGGNMDFNGIAEGATVYLPVSQPGALLYFGDAHAAQGDGELTGNALETSMDVTLTIELRSEHSISAPRVESATQLMAVGLGGSLDDAFRAATQGLARWLEEDYQLDASELALVMGSSVEYQVSEVADRNAGVVAKIAKARLAALKTAKK